MKALLLALAGVLVFAVISPVVFSATGSDSAAGYWRGSGWSRRTSDLKYVTLTTDYQTDFWFNLNTAGELHGSAIVTYSLSFNDAKLRDVISLANRAGNSLFALAPGLVGGLISGKNAAKDLTGMSMAYDESMPVRMGNIRGRLSGQQMRIEWDGTPPPEIRYKRYVTYPLKRELQGEHSHPAYPPWRAPAQVTCSNGHCEAFIPPHEASGGNSETTTTSVWTAYQVSR